jgi:hypothetical protein
MSRIQNAFRCLGSFMGYLALGVAVLWAFGALWFDFPWQGGRKVLAIIALGGAIYAFVKVRPVWRAQVIVAIGVAVIFCGWLTLRPKQVRDWKPEVSQLSSVSTTGDQVVISNVRNFDYRTESDFSVRYETREYDLKQLRGMDLFVTYWGSSLMAHPIVSFDFGAQGRVCFSIETRPEKGEGFSALGGLYRRFELICIAADERDVIRVRTNYRVGEQTYLYHLKSSPSQARKRFLEYVATINGLHSRPRWYNAITDNCTTAIRNQRAAHDRSPWDWRLLVNGHGDRMLYEKGALDQSMPFDELKRRSLINAKAKAADSDPDFSAKIRDGIPGM